MTPFFNHCMARVRNRHHLQLNIAAFDSLPFLLLEHTLEPEMLPLRSIGVDTAIIMSVRELEVQGMDLIAHVEFHPKTGLVIKSLLGTANANQRTSLIRNFKVGTFTSIDHLKKKEINEIITSKDEERRRNRARMFDDQDPVRDAHTLHPSLTIHFTVKMVCSVTSTPGSEFRFQYLWMFTALACFADEDTMAILQPEQHHVDGVLGEINLVQLLAANVQAEEDVEIERQEGYDHYVEQDNNGFVPRQIPDHVREEVLRTSDHNLRERLRNNGFQSKDGSFHEINEEEVEMILSMRQRSRNVLEVTAQEESQRLQALLAAPASHLGPQQQLNQQHGLHLQHQLGNQLGQAQFQPQHGPLVPQPHHPLQHGTHQGQQQIQQHLMHQAQHPMQLQQQLVSHTQAHHHHPQQFPNNPNHMQQQFAASNMPQQQQQQQQPMAAQSVNHQQMSASRTASPVLSRAPATPPAPGPTPPPTASHQALAMSPAPAMGASGLPAPATTAMRAPTPPDIAAQAALPTDPTAFYTQQQGDVVYAQVLHQGLRPYPSQLGVGPEPKPQRPSIRNGLLSTTHNSFATALETPMKDQTGTMAKRLNFNQNDDTALRAWLEQHRPDVLSQAMSSSPRNMSMAPSFDMTSQLSVIGPPAQQLGPQQQFQQLQTPMPQSHFHQGQTFQPHFQQQPPHNAIFVQQQPLFQHMSQQHQGQHQHLPPVQSGPPVPPAHQQSGPPVQLSVSAPPPLVAPASTAPAPVTTSSSTGLEAGLSSLSTGLPAIGGGPPELGVSLGANGEPQLPELAALPGGQGAAAAAAAGSADSDSQNPETENIYDNPTNVTNPLSYRDVSAMEISMMSPAPPVRSSSLETATTSSHSVVISSVAPNGQPMLRPPVLQGSHGNQVNPETIRPGVAAARPGLGPAGRGGGGRGVTPKK